MNRTDYAETMKELARIDAEPRMAEFIADALALAIAVGVVAFVCGAFA